MPLDDAALAALMKANVMAIPNPPRPADAAAALAYQEAYFLAMAKAVNDHIRASALVTGEVTSGLGAGGTVTGTVS